MNTVISLAPLRGQQIGDRGRKRHSDVKPQGLRPKRSVTRARCSAADARPAASSAPCA